MNKPKVSIITVVWNNDKNIKDAIDSVLSQDYENIEYIVIDGESTDGTTSIVQSYGAKIDTFVSEKDDGLYDALNKGIALSTGDIIGFLHSDDIYYDDTVISHVAQCFEDNDALDGVYGDLVYVSKSDISKVIRYWKSKPFEKKMVTIQHPTPIGLYAFPLKASCNP